MQQFKIKTLFIIIVTLFLIFSMSQLLAHDKDTGKEKELIFGVHPYLPATALVERFSPLTNYLGEKMGYAIHIRVATSYQDHIDAISMGEVDFAFLGPASYVKLTQSNTNYSLLGRLSFPAKNTFRGAIIARSNGSLSSVQELQGKKFAFGDPNSTLSTQVPQQMLANAGIKLNDLKSYSHLKNHHNVALAVLMGKYDAGAIKEEVFREYELRGLKVLMWSPDIPSHPFVASSRMATEQVNKLQSLLQNIHLQANAKNILNMVKKGTIAIIPAHIDEYANLRKLIMPQADSNVK